MSEANENGDSWKNPSRIWRKNHREHKESEKFAGETTKNNFCWKSKERKRNQNETLTKTKIKPKRFTIFSSPRERESVCVWFLYM